MSFSEFIGRLSNRDLAKALDLIAPRLDSGLAEWLLQEVAKRLSNKPDPFFVTPPAPDLPSLTTGATRSPFGIIIDGITLHAIAEALKAEYPKPEPPRQSSGYLILPAGLLDEEPEE